MIGSYFLYHTSIPVLSANDFTFYFIFIESNSFKTNVYHDRAQSGAVRFGTKEMLIL